MTIPSELYDVRIYNHSGELYQVLRGYSKLQFTQRINDPWNHEIQLRVSPDNPLSTTLRNLEPDYFVLIWRTDPRTGIKTRVYEGMQQTVSEQVQVNGIIFFTLYGAGYTKLLDRRLVLPTTGEEYNSKEGGAEEIIKSYVFESAVSPVDEDRIIPWLRIASLKNYTSLDSNTVPQAAYNARYTLLKSVVKSIAEDSDLRYGIIGSFPLGSFVFDCRPVWGTDRRKGYADNPMVFSLERNNMLIPLLSKNHRHKKTYAYVGGAGQGTDREVVEVANFREVNRTPWGRSEGWVDARKEAENQNLTLVGTSYLEARGFRESFDFDIYQISNSRWLVDWELGDLVTAEYYDYSTDKEVVEIGIDVTSGESAKYFETLTVKLEEYSAKAGTAESV